MQYYNQSYYLYGTAPPILWATPTMISDLLSLYELHIAGKKKNTPCFSPSPPSYPAERFLLEEKNV